MQVIIEDVGPPIKRPLIRQFQWAVKPIDILAEYIIQSVELNHAIDVVFDAECAKKCHDESESDSEKSNSECESEDDSDLRVFLSTEISPTDF